MPWLQFEIRVDRAEAGLVETMLFDVGAVAVSFEDAGDTPVYQAGVTDAPLWQQTWVRGLLPADTNMDGLRACLLASLGRQTLPAHHFHQLQDRDWAREWLKDFKPMRFGKRLWICPSLMQPPEPAAINLRLDPGLAFGTGAHATTALCLEWLEASLPLGSTLIDYGCGSGVLAIAAACLGAARVWAVDLDTQALAATRENAHRNQVLELMQVVLPQDLPALQVDVLLANILSGPLQELAPLFATLVRPGGALVLSGILNSQEEEVRLAYAHGFSFRNIARRREWLRMDGVRRTD
ncbi:MAG: 50S ribosomal protein L11 methyltransferase [Gammaproteobacteria bacterium]|nr:50S ribosomal protein L11 methyltransferase [Gammaproteobacteria bacterium]